MDDPNIEDHYIFVVQDNLWIPLLLHGIFSYFISHTPTRQELVTGNDILLMTPTAVGIHIAAHMLPTKKIFLIGKATSL